MLKKNYSTLALLFASNVLDGGKDIEKVPTQLKEDVKELVKSLEEDMESDLTESLSDMNKHVTGGMPSSNGVASSDTNSKEVAK